MKNCPTCKTKYKVVSLIYLDKELKYQIPERKIWQPLTDSDHIRQNFGAALVGDEPTVRLQPRPLASRGLKLQRRTSKKRTNKMIFSKQSFEYISKTTKKPMVPRRAWRTVD